MCVHINLARNCAKSPLTCSSARQERHTTGSDLKGVHQRSIFSVRQITGVHFSLAASWFPFERVCWRCVFIFKKVEKRVRKRCDDKRKSRSQGRPNVVWCLLSVCARQGMRSWSACSPLSVRPCRLPTERLGSLAWCVLRTLNLLIAQCALLPRPQRTLTFAVAPRFLLRFKIEWSALLERALFGVRFGALFIVLCTWCTLEGSCAPLNRCGLCTGVD